MKPCEFNRGTATTVVACDRPARWVTRGSPRECFCDEHAAFRDVALLSLGGRVHQEGATMKSKKGKKRPTHVWLLHYRHRHGSDVSVYETHKAAIVAAMWIIIDWRDELDREDAKKVAKLINQQKYESALDAWQKIQNHDYDGEEIEIESQVVEPLRAGPKKIKLEVTP